MRLKVVATLAMLSFTLLALVTIVNVPMEVTAQHEDDELYFEKTPRTTLNVRCPTGVGSATVAMVDKDSNNRFDVVLHLSALEGFVVRTANEVHRIGVNSEGHVVLDPADSLVLHMNELQAMEKAGKFRVTVNPAKFAEPVSGFQLEWVDYYR